MAFNEKMKLKDELTRKITDCELKKDRAEKLTGGLKDEKVRWTKDIADLTSQLDLLPGDSLVSAGMVSYAGPFTNAFRTEME
jgi:dynein heavy chain